MDLRTARMQAALSIEALARRTGLSSQTIWRAEARRSRPWPRTRYVIAAALGLEPSAIVWRD